MMYADKRDVMETMRRLKICVLIPTYNNAGTLAHVVSQVLEYASEVIVVNDGSTDTTQQILEGYAEEIHLVSYISNRGKGHALKVGLTEAMALGFEYAITIDSDGQHYAEDLPLFVRAIAEDYGALIIGQRDLSNVDINSKSSFANRFSNFWFCLQTGYNLKDTQTGYRAYPLKSLRGLSLLTSRYEAELELLVLAAWHGVRLVSIPIQVYYPPQDERITHFKPALDFARISLLNTILCAGAVLYGLPVRIWNAFSGRKLFGREFVPFTHKHGKRKEAATTLGRIMRSLYGIIYFVVWSAGIFTPLAYLYFSIGKNTEAKRFRFHNMLQWVSSFLTRRFPGCKTSYENPTRETFAEPAIIICNHQSHLDLPVLMSIYPKLIFLTNDWVWNNFFYGRIIRNAEFLPVSAGMEVILPQLKNLRDRGYSIVVFPEGTRSADCSILRFRQGAFLLAQELEMDIVPMVLHGAGHYLPKEDFMFRRGEITLQTLPRVRHEALEGLSLREQASSFRKLIRKEYDVLALLKEQASYFESLILYKYAYRGWKVVSRCKNTLKEARQYHDLINAKRDGVRSVRILNSGIGVFALLYALIHKDVEVFAYEGNTSDHRLASETASLPRNLHYKHAVWNSELASDGSEDSLTIVLEGRVQNPEYSPDIYLPLPLRS